MDPVATPHCPVCDGAHLTPCLTIARVPVLCNVLFTSREAAVEAPTGTMDLRYCPGCGHLHNAAFDEDLVRYSADYENSLHHSAHFQGYARSLAQGLVGRHRLSNRTVVEIASGQGDFLRELARLSGSRGVGFDPAYRGPRGELDGVEVIPEHYSEHHARREADLILCRHALEHIASPATFLGMVRRAIGERDTAVYFEVPDARFTLRDLGVWDLIYEHCGYFTRESLTRLFKDAGFELEAVESVFGGQFLGLHGRPAGVPSPAQGGEGGDLAELTRLVAALAAAYNAKVERYGSELAALARSGGRAVVWGAGSKGVSLVNALEDRGAISALIDLNPVKHGRFVPGTGHQVLAPAALRAIAPDLVIVLNPQYRDEIAADLRFLGVRAEILVDQGP